MDHKTANLLVQSLLERLDADATSPNPRFGGVVSAIERMAIHLLLDEKPDTQTPVPPVLVEAEPDVSDDNLAELPGKVAENSEPEFVSGELPIPHADIVNPGAGPATAAPATQVPVVAAIDRTALSLDQPEDDGFVLCLDFGTAKSKAAAASVDEDAPNGGLLELGLGRSDHDVDSSVYTVSSSVWVSDDGLMFAGSEALRQSMEFVLGAVNRRRLDSIKHQLSLANVQQNLDVRPLEPDVNPTSVKLTYEDALCFFLAFLTDTAGKELDSSEESMGEWRFGQLSK